MGAIELLLVAVLVVLAFLVGRDSTAFRRVRDWFARLNPVVVLMVLAAGLFILVAASAPWNFPIGVLGLLFLGFAVLWFREFRYLMQLGDESFPGRNDKTIWALLLILLPPVGLLTFYAFRRSYWPEPKPADARAAHELG